MDDPTYMRVPLDDETMAAAIEQATSARAPIAVVLAAILRDVLLEMKRAGVTLELPARGAAALTESRH